MKRKFSKILGVGLTLALLASMLVMGSPVAANVDTVTVAVNPVLIDTVAEYTIGFNTGADGGLSVNVGTITVTFPADTTVPPSTPLYTTGDITVNGIDVLDTHISVTGLAVTITTPVSISALEAVVVIFTTAAGIVNPTTEGEAYTLSVATSAEVAAVNSAAYTIIGLPTITSVQPASGNVGDTMWVEVKGDNFIEDDTAIDFGLGVSVVVGSYQFVDVNEIDCQILIDADGSARNVIATTGAGTGTEGSAFEPNAEGTAQVDVWDTYTPVVDSAADGTWDAATLAMTGDNVKTTIQAAVDVCNATETVIVHADTYEEMVDIDQTITLQSLSGAATTIIEGANECVEIHASTVVLGGSTGHGFTLQEATGTVHLVQIFGALNTITISDNIFIQSTDGVNAIMVAGTVTGLTVERNDFTLPCKWGMGVFFGGAGTAISLTVTDNDFTGGGSDIDNSAIELHNVDITDPTKDTVISLNTFTDLQNGILIGTDQAGTGLTSDDDPGKLEISGNTFTSLMYAIDLVEAVFTSAEVHNVVITENIFTSNTIALGVNAGAYPQADDDWQVEDFTVKYNDFDGNACGISNKADTAGVLAAKYNYWGEIGGPSAGTTTDDFTANTTALGNGDTISDDVTYNPWLSVSQVTVITEGTRYYGSDTLALEKGWNTLSVPVALYDLANTIAEIEGMGDFLTAENYADYILEYDPVNGWVEPTTVLTPCRGYYIKMLEDSNFPVLYCNSLGLPALELAAGWNLIGSAFGIDKDETWAWAVDDPASTPDEAKMFIGVALDAIGGQVSVVVSPSAPGQIGDPWSVIWATGDTTNPMYTGEGYWVFMTDTGTLAGWEITPFYFTPGTMPD